LELVERTWQARAEVPLRDVRLDEVIR